MYLAFRPWCVLYLSPAIPSSFSSPLQRPVDSRQDGRFCNAWLFGRDQTPLDILLHHPVETSLITMSVEPKSTNTVSSVGHEMDPRPTSQSMAGLSKRYRSLVPRTKSIAGSPRHAALHAASSLASCCKLCS